MSPDSVRVDVTLIPEATRIRLARGMLDICQRIAANPELRVLVEQERATLKAERSKRT